MLAISTIVVLLFGWDDGGHSPPRSSSPSPR
jgi:hypothetical protein